MPDAMEGKGSDEYYGAEMPEYERMRLSRIRENRARLEALGIPGIASSLHSHSPSSKRQERMCRGKKRGSRGKGAVGEEDDDYTPSDADQNQGGEISGESSSFERDVGEEEEEQAAKKRTRGKKRSSLKEAKFTRKGKTLKFDGLMDDDTALKQAIALSLGEQMEGSSEPVSEIPKNSGAKALGYGSHMQKDKINASAPAGRQKNKNVKKRQVQLSEDEVITYFFSFDGLYDAETGKGYITRRDLQRMAIAHDFTWTEGEIYNMIHCFDGDGDGRLSLEDFRAIVCRCKMMQDAGQR